MVTRSRIDVTPHVAASTQLRGVRSKVRGTNGRNGREFRSKVAKKWRYGEEQPQTGRLGKTQEKPWVSDSIVVNAHVHHGGRRGHRTVSECCVF